jgi:hypothetical protein
MPSVTLRVSRADGGTDETLTEYICDWPGCPHVATYVVGVIRELRAFSALCPEHAKLLDRPRQG